METILTYIGYTGLATVIIYGVLRFLVGFEPEKKKRSFLRTENNELLNVDHISKISAQQIKYDESVVYAVIGSEFPVLFRGTADEVDQWLNRFAEKEIILFDYWANERRP